MVSRQAPTLVDVVEEAACVSCRMEGGTAVKRSSDDPAPFSTRAGMVGSVLIIDEAFLQRGQDLRHSGLGIVFGKVGWVGYIW